jgi:5'-3' exonuclease
VKTLFLVDATYELFRSWFGAPPRKSPSGREVGATFGVMSSMLYMIRDEGAEHVACASDHVVRSFRNDLFAGYKTEAGVEADLLSQFALLEEGLAAMGLVVWPMVEFEADDAMAAGVARYAGDFDRIHLCTVDKDLAQCVKDDRIIMVDRRRKQTLDEKGVIEKFGVPPALIPDFLALVGDAADGYPGIPGFGKVSAAALLTADGPLEGLPADPTTWRAKFRGKDKLAPALLARRDEVLLYKRLATLRTDVPLQETAADLAVRNTRETLVKFAESHGMESIIARYDETMAILDARRGGSVS